MASHSRERQGSPVRTETGLSKMDRGLLQRAYAALPVPLQNLAFSILGYRLRRQRYGPAFREKLAWLRESEWASTDEIRAYQEAQLQVMVRHCYDTVPYYRDLFDGLHLRPDDIRSAADLPKLPVINKHVLREHQARFFSRAFDRRKLAAILTSGTTGTPLMMYSSVEAQAFQWAIWWRHRARFGLRVGDPFLTFGARQPVPISQERPPFWRKNHAFNQTYVSTYHFAPRYMPAIVDWLNRTDFDFYTGYPSAMVVLADFIRDHGLRLTNRPKYIVSGAEALLPGFRRTLSAVFGVPVTDQYGAAECCANISQCERGHYHEDYEFGLIEYLDREEGPGHRIVATGFANPAMPLLRYDFGDLVETSDRNCSCGRQSRMIRHFDGRTVDYVRTPDGRMVVGMNQVFEWAPGAREVQIVQDEIQRIVVRIVRLPAWGPDDEHALLREFRNRCGEALAIEFQFVDHIPRSECGKFRTVVSTLPPESATERELRGAVGALESS